MKGKKSKTGNHQYTSNLRHYMFKTLKAMPTNLKLKISSKPDKNIK